MGYVNKLSRADQHKNKKGSIYLLLKVPQLVLCFLQALIKSIWNIQKK